MLNLERGCALAAFNVPQPCGFVVRTGRQCLPIRAKRHARDMLGVSLQGKTLRGGRGAVKVRVSHGERAARRKGHR